MTANDPYKDFIKRLNLLISKNPNLIAMTLSNIFTMRLIGNKTHGDLAEIGISEFINQYMYDYSSAHVGKDLYRKKSREEDIEVTNQIDNSEVSISLKAYGDGPLQLSTDKSFRMFRRLRLEKSNLIDDRKKISEILKDPAFSGFNRINVLPLIYDETRQQCNIMVFDYDRAKASVCKIAKQSSGRGRKHPVFEFLDDKGGYIFEVRYGDAAANALQRGLWTNTKKAGFYFDSVTNGWIDYSHNPVLVKLFSHALVAHQSSHERALIELKGIYDIV